MKPGVPTHDSGLPWLGQIPAHWEVAKFSRAVFIAEGQVDPEDERYAKMLLVAPNHIESGTGRLVARETAADQAAISGKYLCQTGDVIYSKIRPALKKATLATEQCLCSADMYPLRAQAGLDPQFLLLLLLSGAFTAWAILESDRVAMPKINRESLSDLRIPVPPLLEQRAVVAYLDRETAQLDGLVAAKERVLGLVAEKRRTLITRAVTRGLDPRASLRDSGIPWLGEIPAHWEAKRLKFYLHRIEQGWSPQCDNTSADLDEWGVLKAGCVNAWDFDPSENKRLPENVEPLTHYEVRQGDVLMSRANTTALLGSTALVREVRPRLLLCDKLYRLGVNESSLCNEYLVAFLRSPAGRYEFERDATGASNSMQNIGQDSVRNLWLPIPPIDEQRAIVTHITAETAKLDALRAATERTIALLKERRAALIAAAVTGKINVEGEIA